MEWLTNTNNIIYIIKVFVLTLGAYYTDMKILDIKIKENKLKTLLVSLILVVAVITLAFVKINIHSLIYSIVFLSAVFSIIYKYKIGYSVMINVISISINQIIFFLATVISFVIFHMLIPQSDEYINFFIIAVIYAILLKLTFKINRIKNGIIFLKSKENDQYLDLFILDISVAILFTIIIISNYDQMVAENVIGMLIIFFVIMFFTIAKLLKLYYKQKLLVQNLNETKKDLANKEKEVKDLENEILNFNKVSHSIAHKQKALEYKLNQLENSENLNNLKEQIKDIRKDFQQKQASEFDKTGIKEIDNMLEYMQSECIKYNIEFDLKLSGNIYHMTNTYINKEDLEILLADHIKNAIIAINFSKNINRKIFVRLGKIDEAYGIYIYDSGIEFEIKTLENLGKIPTTTHKDYGGTGMGFMNTFDTLNKYKASLEIDEYNIPSDKDFTKVLKFKFDNKNEYKIYSYRYNKIKNAEILKELNLEKIS